MTTIYSNQGFGPDVSYSTVTGSNTNRKGSTDAAINYTVRSVISNFIAKNASEKKPEEYVAQSFVDSTVSMSDFDNMSELAAIILSRTQLRKGEPELALDLLTKHTAQHGESEAVAIEIAKVQGALKNS